MADMVRASVWRRHRDSGPATKLEMGLSAVVDRAHSGDQGAGLEGVPNGCLLCRDARPKKAMARPLGFHPSGRFARLEFVEHAPYPVDFTALDDL